MVSESCLSIEKLFGILDEKEVPLGESSINGKQPKLEWFNIRLVMNLNMKNMKYIVHKLGTANFQFKARYVRKFNRITPETLEDKTKSINFLKTEYTQFYNVSNTLSS